MSYRPYTGTSLYRSDDAVLLGVCGGIAEHFDFAPWGVRCGVILLQLVCPITFIFYIAMGFMLKKRPHYYRDDYSIW